MRAFAAAAVAASLVALAAAGADAQPAPAPGPAPATMTPGVLTVGVNLPTQGFQVGSVIGTSVVYARGFEIELARAMARRMGVRGVRFVHEPTFARVIAPGAKRWDVALAQVTITAGRRKVVALSVPYFASDQGVLLRRGLPEPTPAALADLRPLRLCALHKSTGAATIRTRIRPAAAATLYADQTRMMGALQTGRCDAVVHDAAILAVQRAATPERYGALAGALPTGERYAAVLPRTSTNVAPVNRAINALRRDGTTDALSARWLRIPADGLRPLR